MMVITAHGCGAFSLPGPFASSETFQCSSAWSPFVVWPRCIYVISGYVMRSSLTPIFCIIGKIILGELTQDYGV